MLSQCLRVVNKLIQEDCISKRICKNISNHIKIKEQDLCLHKSYTTIEMEAKYV